MSPKFHVGEISGGNNAFGDHAVAITHGPEPEVLGRLRDELELLVAGLRGVEGAEEARAEAAGLRSEVEPRKPDAEKVRTRWLRLRKALAALGVAGTIPLLADVSQIGSGVQELLQLLGKG